MNNPLLVWGHRKGTKGLESENLGVAAGGGPGHRSLEVLESSDPMEQI